MAEYTVNPFSLNAAGSMIIDQEAGLFVFLRAYDGAGALDLDAEINVSLGNAQDDDVPLTPGQKIIGKSRRWRISWAAQPGLFAKIFLSSSPDDLDVDAQPSKQLVTSGTLATTIAVAAVSVGATATLLRAANASRHKLTVQNNGTDPVYIGPTAVVVATGHRLNPGEKYETDKVTGAFYGIASVAGQDCRVMEETA